MTNWSRSFAQLIEAKMRRIELFSYPVILRLENNPNAVIAMQRFSIVETTAWKNFCDWRLPESRLLGVVVLVLKKNEGEKMCIWLHPRYLKASKKTVKAGCHSPEGMVSTEFRFPFPFYVGPSRPLLSHYFNARRKASRPKSTMRGGTTYK